MRVKEILAEDSAQDLKLSIENCIEDDLDGFDPLGDEIRYVVEKGDTPLPKLAKVVDQFKDEILEYVRDVYYDFKQADILGALELLNVSWPELLPIKEKVVANLVDDMNVSALQYLNISSDLIQSMKSKFIKDLLWKMKHNDLRGSQETLNWLNNHKISWPELDVIQKSLNVEKAKKAKK